ncbi:MAG: hypothetical protein RL375_279 [Pseudomonadota bacterium]|jgi:two-component system sensor histidine kinase RegB
MSTRPWLAFSGVDTEPSDAAALHGLRMLGILRVVAPLFQALTLVVVAVQFHVTVPLIEFWSVVWIEVLLAIATWARVRKSPKVSASELFWQVHLDIALFTVLLFLTGGATNPFAPLFLLPMAIATSALQPWRVWLIALSTMVAYAFLRHWYVPLHHPSGMTEVYELHEDGMVVNYLMTAALAAFFGTRMSQSVRRHERMLADARDAQMRNESVVAIGALAAGYAHELSSPLATMAVVVNELEREHRDDPDLRHQLHLLDEQIQACKHIISSLANSAGQRRTESASGARLDLFIEAIVERARALHPGTTIALRLPASGQPPVVIAEETLRQAITNVIDNAVQASAVHVDVGADWAQDTLVVEVRDRGPGFTRQALERLGKSIGSTKTAAGGLGMGLLLCAATLERLGGKLEPANHPEGGARVTLTVPLNAILINKP